MLAPTNSLDQIEKDIDKLLNLYCNIEKGRKMTSKNYKFPNTKLACFYPQTFSVEFESLSKASKIPYQLAS